MELHHLRYFGAASKEEYFGRASALQHVTRKAVYQMIADLEDDFVKAFFEHLFQRLFCVAIKQLHEDCPDLTLSLLVSLASSQLRTLKEDNIHAGLKYFGPQAAPNF